jgi:hypothetical protein
MMQIGNIRVYCGSYLEISLIITIYSVNNGYCSDLRGHIYSFQLKYIIIK